MNRKGFILQYALILTMLISSMMLTAIEINQNTLVQLSRQKAFKEMYQIENTVIKMIKGQIEFGKTFDFVWYRNGTLITILFHGEEATLTMTGRYNYIAVLNFDSYSKSIMSYYYID